MTNQEKSKILNDLLTMRNDANLKSNFNNYIYQTYTDVIEYISRFDLGNEDDLK